MQIIMERYIREVKRMFSQNRKWNASLDDAAFEQVHSLPRTKKNYVSLLSAQLADIILTKPLWYIKPYFHTILSRNSRECK